MRSIEWWHFQWPWWIFDWLSRSRHFWSQISRKNWASYGQSYYSTL